MAIPVSNISFKYNGGKYIKAECNELLHAVDFLGRYNEHTKKFSFDRGQRITVFDIVMNVKDYHLLNGFEYQEETSYQIIVHLFDEHANEEIDVQLPTTYYLCGNPIINQQDKTVNIKNLKFRLSC